MRVTQIEELGKGRIRVHLDGGSSLVVYKKEVPHLKLEPECELEEEQYREIVEDILIPRAKKRAMYLLEKMDRTEAQLREKLKQNEYPEPAVNAAVDYVKKYHYIDDLRYACNYVRCRSQSKSRRQLALELYRKGVPKIYTEQALEEEYGEEDESVRILRWIEKKGYVPGQADVKQKQKMYQFLMRKGFRSEDVLRML